MFQIARFGGLRIIVLTVLQAFQVFIIRKMLYTYVSLVPRPLLLFTACNIEKGGVAWGRGYTYVTQSTE